MELILRLVMPNYPLKIQTTKGGTNRYFYKKNEAKLPKDIKDELGIVFEYKGDKLYNIARREFVTSITKPKFISIGGNKLHLANQGSSERASNIRGSHSSLIKKTLKDFFKDHLSKVKIQQEIKYPLTVRFIFLATEHQLNDLDGHDIYFRKTFLDTIQTSIFTARGIKKPNKLGFIEDDDVKFINRVDSIGIISDYQAMIVEIYNGEQNSNLQFKYENYVKTILANS